MLGINPDFVGVAGDSAGGNLAAVVSQLVRDSEAMPLCFQALIYPVTDATMSHDSYVEHADDGSLTAAVMAYFLQHYLPEDEDRRNPRISPLYAENFTALPPAMVIVAEYDPLRDDGFNYAKCLEDAGVPVQVEHFANSLHGFISLGGLIGPESGQRAINLIVEAFQKACE